ncbi:MAG TPA: hypothetical protein VJ916_07135 [Anaerovoracaceae bacterium]|nr:hypothetical protein [Anaerovoracaceae bacterium]
MKEKTNLYGYLDLLISNILFVIAFIIFTGVDLDLGNINEVNGAFLLTVASRWPHALGAAGAIFLIAISFKAIIEKMSKLEIYITGKSFLLLFLLTFAETAFGVLIYQQGSIYLY